MVSNINLLSNAELGYVENIKNSTQIDIHSQGKICHRNKKKLN